MRILALLLILGASLKSLVDVLVWSLECFSDSTFSTHYLIVAADDRYHTFGMLVVRDSIIPPSFTSRPEPHPPALTTSEPLVAGMIVSES